MYSAQKKFDEAILIDNDSLYKIALNGDDLNMGMLDVIEEFSGTNAANLAHYYTGMMYLNMNDYQNSIKFLSKFNSNDILLSSLATGSIGDAFAELNCGLWYNFILSSICQDIINICVGKLRVSCHC